MEVALPATGLLTILLAKVRCLWSTSCLTCAYNDPHVPLPVQADSASDEWSAEDSQKTLPPPPIPMRRVIDLRKVPKI